LGLKVFGETCRFECVAGDDEKALIRITKTDARADHFDVFQVCDFVCAPEQTQVSSHQTHTNQLQEREIATPKPEEQVFRVLAANCLDFFFLLQDNTEPTTMRISEELKATGQEMNQPREVCCCWLLEKFINMCLAGKQS
jgi:hypothetical protein